jgi:hypothetical protein
MSDSRHTTRERAHRWRTPAIASVGGVALLAAAALVYTALALLGVPVPGPPRFPGPGGPAAFLIAGVAQLLLAALLALGAVGLFTRRHWGWTVAVTANAVTLLLTAMRPFATGHITPDVIPLTALTGAGLLILLSRPGRGRLHRA